MPLLPALLIQSEMVPTRVDPHTSMPPLDCRFPSPNNTCYFICCSSSHLGMLEWWLRGQLIAPLFSSTIKGPLKSDAYRAFALYPAELCFIDKSNSSEARPPELHRNRACYRTPTYMRV